MFVGGAYVQRGAQDRVVQSGGDGDLLDHAVAPAERRRPVGAVQRPDRHGQELSRGKELTCPGQKPTDCVTLRHMYCVSTGLVCSRKLFQPAERARHRHQVLPESHPGMPRLQALILGRRSLVSWGHLTCTEMVLCSESADAPPSLYPSQVDPGFAYAYTLLGHEFVLTEELDRALACFRNAIRVNNRHYNAWYTDTASTLTTPTDSTCIKVPPRGPALPDRCSLFRNKQMLRQQV